MVQQILQENLTLLAKCKLLNDTKPFRDKTGIKLESSEIGGQYCLTYKECYYWLSESFSLNSVTFANTFNGKRSASVVPIYALEEILGQDRLTGITHVTVLGDYEVLVNVFRKVAIICRSNQIITGVTVHSSAKVYEENGVIYIREGDRIFAYNTISEEVVLSRDSKAMKSLQGVSDVKFYYAREKMLGKNDNKVVSLPLNNGMSLIPTGKDYMDAVIPDLSSSFRREDTRVENIDFLKDICEFNRVSDNVAVRYIDNEATVVIFEDDDIKLAFVFDEITRQFETRINFVFESKRIMVRVNKKDYKYRRILI